MIARFPALRARRAPAPVVAALLAVVAAVLAGCGPRVDIHYVPTPEPVVDAMLDMAAIEEGDVLYDLGSGDGRIPIAAARQFGVRAVGIEIDPRLVREARANAKAAGVAHLVEFREADLFATDFSDADVVTLYLGDTLNLRLRPQLLEQLEPGDRVVSHDFAMGDWPPDEKRIVANRPVYKWTVPETFIPGFGGVD
ncbi:SAM-dependent methyltransferase [Pelagerythrobacter marinus]|uniref:SAM-dependent methyltransferase n=1 Tax=Pelagerythrobacter marinus TaxID=538382 RepID=UPI002036B0EF|nr:class I SAM-dependent methyltransferase [Pelagerythrobacter marinus]USA40032.1 methyltransferase domain-containing protein [Pelagerythrobacter marinus]WPZ05847.1 class I SAM-dependent methyltransferase [Pelagerythrobacter marinus]